MKTGGERAGRREASEAPPVHRPEYEHQLPKPFEECSDEELSDYITTMVIPHTIAFFSQMVYCNKDYRDVVQNIINNLAKSKSHFLYFQNILKQLP